MQRYDPPILRLADKANQMIQNRTNPAQADLTNEGVAYMQKYDGDDDTWKVLYALKDNRPATVSMLSRHENCRSMSRQRIISILSQLEKEHLVQKV